MLFQVFLFSILYFNFSKFSSILQKNVCDPQFNWKHIFLSKSVIKSMLPNIVDLYGYVALSH